MRRRVRVTGSAFDASNWGGRTSLYASVEAIRTQAKLRLRRLRDVDVGPEDRGRVAGWRAVTGELSRGDERVQIDHHQLRNHENSIWDIKVQRERMTMFGWAMGMQVQANGPGNCKWLKWRSRRQAFRN